MKNKQHKAIETLPDDSSIIIESVEDDSLDYEQYHNDSMDILDDGDADYSDDLLVADW